MAFSDQQLEELRERADMVALVGKRVQLRKAGKDFVGLCPFHGERSPSFYVVPGKRIYHCFGCGETGDAFKFLMKLDGLGFMDAVKAVAGEAGVTLVDEQHDPEEARRRAHNDQLANLMDRAVKFYEQKLWHDHAKPIREYVLKRGVTEESIRRFKLGFGGYGRDELSKALEKANVEEALAVEAGLCIASSRGGRAFDRFHGRLIVPIRIPRPPDGRAIALGGRFLEGVTPERSDGKVAKYINSPETPLYQKGHVLFGLHEARDTIRKEERAVIVEGYFDVIGLHQAGVPLAVASCGTSLTANHLELLLRTGAKEVVFLFDGDEAGVRAASKAATLCAKTQVPARVAVLPQGLDPDDFARQRGAEGLRALFDRARSAIEVLIDAALSEAGPEASVEERVRAVQAVREVVLSAPEGLSRELYVSQIAERLKVSEAAVKSALFDEPVRPHRTPGARPGGDRPGPRAPGGGPRRPAGPERNAPLREVPEDVEEPTPQERRTLQVPQKAARTAAEVTRERLARKTLSAEEGLAIALLRYPVLAATVEQEGVVAEFANPDLRAICDLVLAKVHEGEPVEPGPLLSTVTDQALQADLVRKLRDDDSNLQQSAEHFQRVLDRLLVEIARARSRALAELMAESTFTSASAEYQREVLDKKLANDERARTVHKRIQERNRRPGSGGAPAA